MNLLHINKLTLLYPKITAQTYEIAEICCGNVWQSTDITGKRAFPAFSFLYFCAAVEPVNYFGKC